MFLKELDVNRRTISKQEDLSHYITHFYAKLYTVESPSPDIAKAQRKCWESISAWVIENMNAEMIQELSLVEVVEVITFLPKGKSPCHDSLATEFFQENVEKTDTTFLLAFRTMFWLGLTSYFINKGTITLIPNSGYHSKLRNWCPITLLGSIYKIFAKILVRRI